MEGKKPWETAFNLSLFAKYSINQSPAEVWRTVLLPFSMSPLLTVYQMHVFYFSSFPLFPPSVLASVYLKPTACCAFISSLQATFKRLINILWALFADWIQVLFQRKPNYKTWIRIILHPSFPPTPKNLEIFLSEGRFAWYLWQISLTNYY